MTNFRAAANTLLMIISKKPENEARREIQQALQSIYDNGRKSAADDMKEKVGEFVRENRMSLSFLTREITAILEETGEKND